MPWFTLHRNYALSTTKGHSVNFKKGERTWVPKALIEDVLALGAKSEDPIEDLTAVEEKTESKLTDTEVREKMFAAFEKLLLRNQRGDFMASGTPHPKRLFELTSIDLPQRDRDGLWLEYNAMKSAEAEEGK